MAKHQVVKAVEAIPHVAARITEVQEHAEQAAQAVEQANNTAHNAAIASARQDEHKKLTASSALIPLVKPVGEVFVPGLDQSGKPKGERDKVRTPGQIERELPHLSREQANMILHQHDRASFSLASACASIWADEVMGTAQIKNIALDLKLWKALKASIEARIVPADQVEFFAFPQQWQDYATALKSYLGFGGDVTALLYRNKEGAECVRTRYWLKQEAARLDTSPATTKADRIAKSISSAVETALGGKEGKGELIAAGAIDVDHATATMLLDIAEANLGTYACRERLDAEDVGQTLRRLVAQNGKDAILAMLAELAD